MNGGEHPKKILRRLLRNALFSLLTASLAIGGLELGLRLLGVPDMGIYQGDPGYFWTLSPSLGERELPFPEQGTSFKVRTNSLGFRGPEPARGAILCLGDSTTFAWGVQETESWPSLLQDLLDYPVMNAGVPGYSVVQGRRVLPGLLERVQPEVVIFGYLVRDAELAPAPDESRRPGTRLQILRAMRSLRPQRSPPVSTGVPRVSTERYQALLGEMLELARDAGAMPVLLAFPMRSQPERYLRVLESLAQEQDTPLLRPNLPAQAFFEADPIHLNPAGNQLLARAIAYSLDFEGLSP